MAKPPRSASEPILSKWLLTRCVRASLLGVWGLVPACLPFSRPSSSPSSTHPHPPPHPSYLITGSYVGFATVGIFVQWFLKRGVTWQELTHWGHCVTWKEQFAPDLAGLEGLLGACLFLSVVCLFFFFNLRVWWVWWRVGVWASRRVSYCPSSPIRMCVARSIVSLHRIASHHSSHPIPTPYPLPPTGETADKCGIFGPALASPQTLSLSVLVTMEMLKALAAVSLDNSIVRVPPWRNPWLMGGVALPFSIHLAVVYFPWLNRVFGVSAMSAQDWLTVLQWAAPILLLEEVLKAVGRYLKGKENEAVMAERKQRLASVAAAATAAAAAAQQQHPPVVSSPPPQQPPSSSSQDQTGRGG